MSANHRWLKWWPQDWQRDPALRSCCLAARGLWMDFICMMHEGSPYGHLTINNKAPSLQQLATISGITLKDVTKLVAELEEAGVFSRTPDAIIFCRRMIRDNEASELGREYISRRYNGQYSRADKPPNGSAPPSDTDRDPNRGPNGSKKKHSVHPVTPDSYSKSKKVEPLLRNDAGASRHSRSDVWTSGVASLIGITGFSERTCRGLVGRWCRDAKDDFGLVGEVLAECADFPRADNVAWITAAITSRVKPPQPFDWDAAFGIKPEPPQHDLDARLDGDSFRVH